MGASYMVTKEGIINVLNFRARGMGTVFQMWAHEQAPLNTQWPVLNERWC